MSLSINPVSTSYPARAVTVCLQKLRDLAAVINRAVVAIFRCFCPCFFGKKESPLIKNITISSAGQNQSPPQVGNINDTTQLPYVAPPKQLWQTSHHNSGLEEKSNRKDDDDEKWPNYNRNITTTSKPAEKKEEVKEQAPISGVASSAGNIAKQTRGILGVLEEVWPKLQMGESFVHLSLDAAYNKGLQNYDENDVSRTLPEIVEASGWERVHIIKQKQNSIVAFHQSLLCNQLLTILHNNAKSHGAYGALLVGELFMVGLFVKHNEGTTTFYLIEGDEKVSITKYSGVQLLGQYLDTKAPYYSCTAFKTKDGAGS